MKAIVSRRDLVDALTQVSPAIAHRPEMPIQSAVHVVALNGSLTLTATGSNLTLSRSIPAGIGDDGSVYVSGHRLRSLAAALTAHEVDLQTDGKTLVVSCGRSTHRLSLMDGTYFPPLPKAPSVQGTVGAAAFADALKRIAHASGGDDLSSVRGMSLKADGRYLSIGSTDRFRVASVDISYDGEPFTARPYYSSLISASKAVAGAISIGVDGNNLGISDRDFSLVTGLIDGDYPNFDHIVSKIAGVTIRTDRAELLAALVRMRLAEIGDPKITVDVTSDEIRLSARDEMSDLLEVVDCVADQQMTFGIDPVYLHELLSCITEPAVEIVTPVNGAMRVAGLSDDGTRSEDLHVLMTKRLS